MTFKKGLFFAFAACIVLIPLYVAVNSQNILNSGKLYKFKPMAYDPFDPFRGKFLRVNYQTNSIPTTFDFEEGEMAYVSIGVDKEGYAFFEEAFKVPPKDKDYVKSSVEWSGVNDLLLREIENASDSDNFDLESIDTRSSINIKITDNMNKYFINEDDALKAEKVFLKERENIHIGVRILDGEVRLEDIYVSDKPILDYLAEN